MKNTFKIFTLLLALTAVVTGCDKSITLDEQLSPHLGYVTEGNYRVAYPQIVEDIKAYLAGNPIRTIEP